MKKPPVPDSPDGDNAKRGRRSRQMPKTQAPDWSQRYQAMMGLGAADQRPLTKEAAVRTRRKKRSAADVASGAAWIGDWKNLLDYPGSLPSADPSEMGKPNARSYPYVVEAVTIYRAEDATELPPLGPGVERIIVSVNRLADLSDVVSTTDITKQSDEIFDDQLTRMGRWACLRRHPDYWVDAERWNELSQLVGRHLPEFSRACEALLNELRQELIDRYGVSTFFASWPNPEDPDGWWRFKFHGIDRDPQLEEFWNDPRGLAFEAAYQHWDSPSLDSAVSAASRRARPIELSVLRRLLRAHDAAARSVSRRTIGDELHPTLENEPGDTNATARVAQDIARAAELIESEFRYLKIKPLSNRG